MKAYHTKFSLFICQAVCFVKMNIPTELTPIWQCWHEADGCSSYVERCYRRLTVKICYLNRVACWRRVACRLLSLYTWIRLCEGHWYKTEHVKLFNSRGQIEDITFTCALGVYLILNIVNLNGGDTKLELFWEHFSSIQFQVFLPWCAQCWKSDVLVRAEGIGLPLIHSLPHHLLSLLLEILSLLLPLFMFWSAIPECCEPN